MTKIDAATRRTAEWGAFTLVVLAMLCMGLTAVATFLAFDGHFPAFALATFVTLALVLGLLVAAFLRVQRAQHLLAFKLEKANDQLSGVVESAMDPIVSVNTEQVIVVFNAAAERVFGCARSQVVGQHLEILLPERFRPEHGAHVRRFGQTGTSARMMGGQTVLMARRADGSEFPIEASISQYGKGPDKLLTVILRDVTQRVRDDAALRRSKEELSLLANAANSAREQEKMRISRELHDELAQALTALNLDVSWIRKHLPAELEAIDDKLMRIGTTLDATVAATRRIASDLRPMLLDDLGLAAAAEWLVENFTERTGVACSLEFAISEEALPPAHANAIFRILQESLTNIARHAHAPSVEVAVRFEADSIVLTVRDHGVGFPVGTQGKTATFGLLGIRERAYMLGGEVAIESQPGRGARVEVRLPLARSEVTSP